jgi:hypothetical protein
LEKKRIASPREEALSLALKARRDVLEKRQNPASTLRSCLVIASILNKKDVKEWVNRELHGYTKRDEIPAYRIIDWNILNRFGNNIGFTREEVWYGTHELQDNFERKEKMFFIRDSNQVMLNLRNINRVLSAIVDRCLNFLNEIISELQYGGTVEYLMEEIRKNTDEKLVTLDSKLANEAQSLFLNLTSTNPADWNKVGHSSRKMLKILADNVFPARAEKYKMKDERELGVGDPHFINRLCAFLDQKVTGEERRFLISEIEYFESYLRQVTKYAQMGEHAPSIEKYHADMLAIHTYLILSEVLKHQD